MANNLYARIIIAAQDSTAEALASVRTGFTGIGDAISNAKNLLLSYFAIDFIKTQVVDVIALADKYTDLTSRLKLSTTSHEELVRVQTALTEIAKTTRTDLESVETIYVRNIAAIKRMGGSEQDALAITETLTKAFKVSGATTEETTATLIQLSQGLSSGVLRGQEFNSMMEQGPRVAQALAAGLDVPIGSLRKMAEQGQLTSDRVLAALLSQKDAIATEYGQLEITVSGTMNVLATRFLEFVGKTNEATGATKTLVDGINYLTGASDRAGGSLVKTISDLLTKLSDLTSIQTLGTLLTTVFTDTKTAVGFVLEVVSQLWTTLSSSAEIARFGDALSNAFVVAEKLAKTLWDGITAILALFGSSTPQAWGDALAAMFSKVADVGSVALNTITTVLDTVKAGFFGLAGAGATAMQGLAEGIAKVQDGIAAISFGELSAKMTAQAENNRTVADAFGESAKLNFGKAETALTSAATSGLALRQAYSDLESGAAAVTAPVEQLTTAVAATGNASGITADELDKLGANAQIAGGQLVAVADSAAKTATVFKDSVGQALALETAYKDLSVKSADELNKLADSADQSFLKIKSSGKASSDELVTAFTAYADKSIAANGGVVSALLKTEAAASKLSVTADAAGKAVVHSLNGSTAGVQELNNAYKDLGIKASDELKKLATDAETAFNTIKNSGKASATDILTAFTAYADKAIAANDGVVSGLLAAEAATSGLKIATDEAGKTIVTSYDSSAKTAKQLADEIKNTADETKKLAAQEQQQADAKHQQVVASIADIRRQEQAQADAAAQASADFAAANKQVAETLTTAANAWLVYDFNRLKALGQYWVEADNGVQGYGRSIEKATLYNNDLADSVNKFNNNNAYKPTQLGLERFISSAEAAVNQTDHLSQANVALLTSSLSAARAQLQGMASDAAAAKSTLTGLQNELDQLHNNQAAIEQRKFLNDQLDLEARLAKARATNNLNEITALRASLELLNQIHGEKIATFAADSAAAASKLAVTPTGHATGGLISGPGTGTSDSIPAMLSDGEFVIPAAAAAKVGQSFLEQVRVGNKPQGFATGGSVGATSVAATNQTITLQFKSPSGQQAQGIFSATDATSLLQILKDSGAVTG